ncbi:hypothetical protein bcgnr5372_38990 [Bacillus luti]|nr:transposase [Bacillus cereus]HDR8330814.1 transposase [Bacillus cereus]HDR8337485.1 transposase [Bacillus cereus]
MKNHIRLPNGQVIQTNKKWSHLKQRQRDAISSCLREAYISKVRICNRRLKKAEHDDVLGVAFTKIEEWRIWIPEHEVVRYYKSKVNKWHNIHKK